MRFFLALLLAFAFVAETQAGFRCRTSRYSNPPCYYYTPCWPQYYTPCEPQFFYYYDDECPPIVPVEECPPEIPLIEEEEDGEEVELLATEETSAFVAVRPDMPPTGHETFFSPIVGGGPVGGIFPGFFGGGGYGGGGGFGGGRGGSSSGGGFLTETIYVPTFTDRYILEEKTIIERLPGETIIIGGCYDCKIPGHDDCMKRSCDYPQPHDPNPVPEPHAIVLVLMAFPLLAFYMWRKPKLA